MSKSRRTRMAKKRKKQKQSIAGEGPSWFMVPKSPDWIFRSDLDRYAAFLDQREVIKLYANEDILYEFTKILFQNADLQRNEPRTIPVYTRDLEKSRIKVIDRLFQLLQWRIEHLQRIDLAVSNQQSCMEELLFLDLLG